MKLQILNSDSSGNSYILTDDNGKTLLIEAGIKFDIIKQILNFKINNIVGCLISHSHSDHARYVKQFDKAGINIYAMKKTLNQCNINGIPAIQRESFFVDDFFILPLSVKHDIECFSYVITHKEMGKLYFVTDTAKILYKVHGLNHLMIECNYSQDVVDDRCMNDKINNFVRYRTEDNHLSFEYVLKYLDIIDTSKLKNIILIHLSKKNSDAKLFKKEIENITGINTIVADKNISVNISKNPI